jgi:hypothetical protein
MNNDEFTGRYHDGWISKRFVLPLRNIKQEASVTLRGRRLPYPEYLEISVYVNDNLIFHQVNPGMQFTVEFTVPPLLRGTLQIVSSHTFIPKEKGMNEDVRELSFLLDEILVPSLPNLMEPYNHLFDFKPSRKVYFLEDELWDAIAFYVPDKYKCPDKHLLNPLREKERWEINPHSTPILRGTVYDKFSGRSLPHAKVQLFDRHHTFVGDTVTDANGGYEIQNLSAGEYVVTGKSNAYGDQKIRFAVKGTETIIHLPMLPF